MKRRTLHLLLLVIVAGLGLAGCRSDVKLDDVTVDSKVGAKFGLPIGEMSVSLGDVVGLINFGNDMQVSVNADSTMVLTVDKHYDNEFHAIELTDYTGTVESDSPVKEIINSDFIPARTKEEVPFEMEIKFDGVNDDTSDERIDSMVIERASFTTKVTNNFGLTEQDIDSVVMVLGPQFRRAKGTREILPNFSFNKDIKIELDNFTLVMMKDESKRPADDNVVNNATITFLVYLNYKPDGNNNPFDPGFEYLPIYPTSVFHFNFKVEMMTYTALYGYFEPGKETRDINKVDVDIKLPGSDSIIFAPTDPKITLEFTYGLSMPLAVNLNELKAIHSDGSETLAKWKNQTSHFFPLENVLPIDAPLDDNVKDYITLSSDPEHGSIDNFFKREVKALGYDYKLDVDRNMMANLGMYQFRMTHNTKFGLDFHFEMPFKFGPEMHLSYEDNISGIDLERARLDSLAAMTNGLISSIDSATLTLYLIITNEIPVAVTLDAYLLDENDKELAIEGLKDLQNLQIKPATKDGADFKPSDPVMFPTTIKTDDFNTLAEAKSLRLKVTLGDGVNPSQFITNKRLRIKAGITADVQGVLNMSLGQDNTNNK